MSRLTDVIRQAKAMDPVLGADLESELRTLSERRVFGLNFERHHPETVELPERLVRKGDKVRVLPERGSTGRGDQRLWRVTRIETVNGGRFGTLALIRAEDTEIQGVPVEDLVVVAEFRDPIFPGLESTDRVERGGDKPFHVVINAENFHALQMLLYTHRAKADCIYVDPPYNTGAKDWKYNNDYVDGEDLYRHSKWLAFMERRLLIAKELLNPDDSVLIVTIDEREYLRLGLLLQQLFPQAQIEMVTSVISAKGVARFGQFSRVEEYIFTLRIGSQEVALSDTNMLDESRSASEKVGQSVDWLGLRRREPTARRGARPKQFYPVFVDSATGYVDSIGDAITNEVDRASVDAPVGTFAVWPLLPDGTEGLWGITPETARAYLAGGFVRSRNYKPEIGYVAVQYLPGGTVAAIEAGDIEVVGRDQDGSVVASYKSAKGVIPKRVWNMASHNAETGGTVLLSRLLPNRRFPFPKSLYAVEDTLRFFVRDKPHAVVIDFFAGSGTTAHAVMRLNRQDGGRRQSVSITNNEVSADEQGSLRSAGLRPGDPDWEEHGICEFITKPRLRAAVTGVSPTGEPLTGAYKFVDEFPMSEGFEENVESLTLTYESPWRVARNRDFAAVAPMLWLRAGAQGRRIDSLTGGWDVADSYGVIEDLDEATPFLSKLTATGTVRVAFIVTDDDRRFQMICAGLPTSVEPVRLYESYLRNFELTWE